jgi:hypothetical protein
MRQQEIQPNERGRSGRRGLVFGLALLIAVFSFPSRALAAELTGTVVDSSDRPRRRARVELLGPEKKLLVTDGDGRFTVSLRDGTYRVRITDGRRSMVFENVDVFGELSRTFTLEW